METEGSMFGIYKCGDDSNNNKIVTRAFRKRKYGKKEQSYSCGSSQDVQDLHDDFQDHKTLSTTKNAFLVDELVMDYDEEKIETLGNFDLDKTTVYVMNDKREVLDHIVDDVSDEEEGDEEEAEQQRVAVVNAAVTKRYREELESGSEDDEEELTWQRVAKEMRVDTEEVLADARRRQLEEMKETKVVTLFPY